MANPLLQLSSIRIPFDAIEAEHVRPAVRELLAEARARVEAVGRETQLTYARTLGALEAATERLELAMGVVSHLESVATTPALREAYNEIRPEVSAFYAGIPLDPKLYAVLDAYAKSDEAAALDPIRKRHTEKTLDDFRRHGAALDDEGKKRLEALDVELSKLTTTFSQNVLDSTNEFELLIEDASRLRGLPQSAIEAAKASAEEKGKSGYRFTLQAPSVMAVLTYLDDEAIREQVWRAYGTRASRGEHDNRAVLERIVAVRAEKAKLLRYADFSDLVLEDRMAKNGAAAERFVADLEAKTRAAFERENAELEAFRNAALGADAGPMQPWSVGYWSEKQRKARFDFDEEALRPYFPVEGVLQGLFGVAERLYGVRVERWEDAPTWHPAVRTYRMLDPRRGEELGAFYVDLHPRDSKRGGAWMNSFITGHPLEGGGFAPHLGLFCANASPPVGGKPALLTHSEVETLFHEFGHLLHHLLSRVPIKALAGTRVAWDFVELPSQIMENWTWEREALDVFARHYETGETIPQALYEKMVRARTYRAASAQMRQLGFATTDLSIHRHFEPGRDGDVVRHARSILERFSATALPDDYAMILAFTHLFAHPVGYAAGYYSYKWAEVLDADAFSRFKNEGLFNAEVGGAFRDRVLSRGDSEDPMKLFVDFMGREPRLEALLERSGLSEARA